MGRWWVLPPLAIATAMCATITVAQESGRRAQPGDSQGARQRTVLTLEEAWRRAQEANPSLLAVEAGQAAAEGERRDSRATLWNNPVLSVDATRRAVPSTGLGDPYYREWSAGISQTLEVAGQPALRRKAADAALEASRLDVDAARKALRAELELRFTRVLELQERTAVERAGLRLTEDASAAVGKRVRAGEDTRLDGNLAAVEAERARNALSALDEEFTTARAALAELLQLPPETLPEAGGNLTEPAPPPPLAQLLAQARTAPRIRALERREAEAQSRLELERASVYPDVALGLSTGREGPAGAQDRLTTLSISVPLPLFRRNGSGIGRAQTEVDRARIAREAAGRDSEAAVRSLWIRLESLRERVRRLADSVLPRLDENQKLSVTALRAGEIELTRLLLVNRQLIDARRDYLQALGELVRTRIALERAVAGNPGEAR